MKVIVKEKFVELSKVDRVRVYLCYRGVFVTARALAIVGMIQSSAVNTSLLSDVKAKRVEVRNLYAVSSGRYMRHYRMTRKGMRHYPDYKKCLLQVED